MVAKVDDSEEEEEEISSLEKSMKQLKVTKSKIPGQKPAPSKAERPVKIDHNPVEVVTHTFTVWFTSLSKNFLREGTLSEATQKMLDQENFQSKYQSFCSQLDVKIAQDNAIDQQLLREDKTQLKPLASYEQLKKEAEKRDLKVRAFFNGQWEYAEDTVEEEPVPESNHNAEEGQYFVTPLVDATAQKALRRRVVMQNLEK